MPSALAKAHNLRVVCFHFKDANTDPTIDLVESPLPPPNEPTRIVSRAVHECIPMRPAPVFDYTLDGWDHIHFMCPSCQRLTEVQRPAAFSFQEIPFPSNNPQPL